IALLPREDLARWLELAGPSEPTPRAAAAEAILAALRRKGSLFWRDIAKETGELQTWLEQGVAELVAAGLVTCDSFVALRQLLVPFARRKRPIDPPGRFSLVREAAPAPLDTLAEEAHALRLAQQYLLRYGVLVRRVLVRERAHLPWRLVLRALR